MPLPAHLQAFLTEAFIDPSIFKLRPDYRALLLIISNITPEPSSPHTDSLLSAAESKARDLLSSTPVTSLPHIAAWRDAYKAFGAKPTKTRNSLEALTRRLATPDGRLPRVNRLMDVYNAVSVGRQVPLGGEDLSAYEGAPRLVRATGEEEGFETLADGKVEKVDVGEVVWCDGKGVTCRRWNWRQGRRTALGEGSKDVLFILDGLDAMSDAEMHAAADELVEELSGEGSETARRLMGVNGDVE